MQTSEEDRSRSANMVRNRKGCDVELDLTWSKYLVNEIQTLSPYIGAVIFKDSRQVVFFYKNIIIYKVLMNELNIQDIKFKEHKEKVRTILKMIDLDFIPLKDLNECRKGIKGINLKLGTVK